MKTNSFQPRFRYLVLLLVLNLPGLPCVRATPPGSPQATLADRLQLEFEFQGKVESVDVSAQTFKVDGKGINVTRDTKITKDGNPIKLDEVRVGDSVRGLIRQGFNGKLEAVTVKVVERKT